MEAWKSDIRPTIICGLKIRCRNSKHPSPEDSSSVESLNNQNNESSIIIMDVDDHVENSCLYLVVYDFQYKKECDYLDLTDLAADNKNETTGELSKVFKWNEMSNVGSDTQMDTVSNTSDDASLEIKVI